MLDQILEASILAAVVFEAWVSWRVYQMMLEDHTKKKARRILRKILR